MIDQAKSSETIPIGNSSNRDTTPKYEIIQVPDIGIPKREALLQQCYDLRIQVFTHEQGFPLETELDEYDTHPSTVHFLMRLLPSEEPVGTIRAVRLPEYYKLTRLVVAKPYRKYRLGRSLVLALHEYVVQDARERGATPGSTITCVSSSQIPVKNFYARYGYEPEGDEYDDEGQPHQKMVAKLRIPYEPSAATSMNP